MRDYFVYILRCDGDRLYTGCTVDMKKRLESHMTGKGGAKFTRGFRPAGVAALWLVSGGRGQAQRVEALIKSLTADEKKSLAAGPLLLAEMVSERGIETEVTVCDAGAYEPGLHELNN